MTQFSSIGLIGHLHNERATYSLKRLISFLQKRDVQFVLEQGTAGLLVDDPMLQAAREVVHIDSLGKLCDLVIVVGGDGSLLRGARVLAKHHVPLLGVNRGRLGFLTDIMPEEIESKVEEVLSGKYILEERFLLDMAVMRGKKVVETGDALNDVVLHPGQFIHMLQYEIYIDGNFVTTQSSDGIIVSTPTGSTAYSLSCGGPVVMPDSDNFVITPIAPHNLNVRPVIISSNDVVALEIEGRSPHFLISVDSHSEVIPSSVKVKIKKANFGISLIKLQNHDFLSTLRNKLMWGVDKRN